MCKLPKNIHCGYTVLETEVLPFLDGFQDDIKVYDKRELTGYTGDFISMYRKSGTDLVLLDTLKKFANWNYSDILSSINATHELHVELIKRNQHFLYVDKDGAHKEITREEVLQKIKAKKQEAEKFYTSSFEKMSFFQMAFQINSFKTYNGSRWRSKLQEEWMSDKYLPEFRRLRNHFGSDILKRIKNDFDEVKIRTLLIETFMEGI